MKKHFRKGLALLMALIMVFAMASTAFATTGSCTVKCYVPIKYDNIISGGVVTPTIPDHFNLTDVPTMKGMSKVVDLSTIKECAVKTPDGFTGLLNTDKTLPYLPTAFDALYKGYVAGGENPTTMEYGFDTYAYSDTGVPMHGIYFSKLAGLTSDTFESYYDQATGSGYWVGYSWSLYDVPAGVSFDPKEPNKNYKTQYYANNIVGTEGHTYYMIYEYNEENF